MAKEIRIDNFAALFATDNDEMAFRHLYRETFSADDNQLVAVLERKNISDATLVQILEDISNLVKSISALREFSQPLKAPYCGLIRLTSTLTRCLGLISKKLIRPLRKG